MSLIARDKLAVTSTSSSLKKAISSATGQVQAHLCSLERQDEPVLCFLCSARAASESSRSSYYSLHMEGSWKLELRWESNITVSIITATPLTSVTNILQSSCEEISGRSSHAPSVVTSLSSVSTKEPELDTQRQLYLVLAKEKNRANKRLPPSCPHASKDGPKLRACRKRYKRSEPEHFSTSSQPNEHTSQQLARHTRSQHETSGLSVSPVNSPLARHAFTEILLLLGTSSQ
ncbi:hypothetical protein DY000_02032132 [Brassica cretica]|uniref:Uncharacterized protein n=1 Tax=Brassica cretica TaxID=69181 RepID=A0ABQ7DPX7_BRACR|nr:hypothetical protein DY000_02032132 [Brassica cretica]